MSPLSSAQINEDDHVMFLPCVLRFSTWHPSWFWLDKQKCIRILCCEFVFQKKMPKVWCFSLSFLLPASSIFSFRESVSAACERLSKFYHCLYNTGNMAVSVDDSLDSSATLLRDAERTLAMERYDPCNNECIEMRSYGKRLLSFTNLKWTRALIRSPTTCPSKMAVNWYCTGTDTARCFACFKVFSQKIRVHGILVSTFPTSIQSGSAIFLCYPEVQGSIAWLVDCACALIVRSIDWFIDVFAPIRSCFLFRFARLAVSLHAFLTFFFVFFKELEGWAPTDDPEAEHSSHCGHCPLIKYNLISPTTGLSNLTLRQQIRLDVAIEFERKRTMTRELWGEAVEAFEEMHETLSGKIDDLKFGKFVIHVCRFDFFDGIFILKVLTEQ